MELSRLVHRSALSYNLKRCEYGLCPVSENDTSFEVLLPAKSQPFRLSNNGGLDHIMSMVRKDGLANYEAPLPDLMAWLVQTIPGVMLDVGANTGLFSLLAVAANRRLRVHSFEPLDSVRTLLNANLALNPRLASRVGVYGVGLSNAEGTFDFFETINDHGLITTSSSLEMSHAEQIGRYRKQTIQTQTMDGWAAHRGFDDISLIKIDVEGHEYAVIEGARKTILKHRPMITIELLSGARADTIEKMIFEESYIDLAITPTGFRNSPTLAFHPDGWNHLLCPSEKLSLILNACQDLNLKLEIV